MAIQPNQIEVTYDVADKAKLDGVEPGAQVNPAIATQAEAEAGLDNAKMMTALRVAQAISVLAGGGSGETNTASNEGAGEGLFIQKAGVNLEFKTLIAGTGVTFGIAATTLTINASAGGLTDTDDLLEGATNLYYTEGRVTANSSVAANTAKVSADGSIATHSDVTLSSPTNGQVLTYNGSAWVNAAASGGSAAVVAAQIVIPTAGSLAARIAAATGLPAGWSIVLGNDGAVNAGLTSVGANASDIVIITGEGKSPAAIKVMKDFGGLVRQQVTYDPSTGDILESNDYNQILLKDPQNGTKAGTAQFEISIIVPL